MHDLFDGLTRDQFLRIRNAERGVIDARLSGNAKALVQAQRLLGNVQFEIWLETKSNA